MLKPSGLQSPLNRTLNPSILAKLNILYPRSLSHTGSALQLLSFPITLPLHIHQSYASKFLRERHSGFILQIWICPQQQQMI